MSNQTSTKRINFARSKILEYPDLLEVQLKSFKDFFQLETTPESLVLDLGEVHEIAEVIVNGKSVRTLWKVPYRLDISDYVIPGDNTLEVKVTSLWPNRLIRDAQLPEEERLTHITYPFYGPDDPLQPAGLIGPVILSASD